MNYSPTCTMFREKNGWNTVLAEEDLPYPMVDWV